MLQQPRLDLAELDPETADLHLEVVAAQKLDIAVRQVATKVTRPVEPVTFHERARHKPLRRQLGTVQITARHTRTADVELASDALGNRLHPLIQKVNSCVRNGSADRRRRIAAANSNIE